jgi:hypothetical protein
MHQQRLRAQVTTPSDLQPTNKVLVVASHTYPQHPALHADRPHTPMASNQGVLHFCPLAKYAIAFPKMSRSIVTRQLGSQTADLHLLGGHLRPAVGTFQRAFPMSLDPVEQRLLNQPQPARCSRDTLARLNKPNRLLLELERVPRPRRLNRQLRNTFRGGKITGTVSRFVQDFKNGLWPPNHRLGLARDWSMMPKGMLAGRFHVPTVKSSAGYVRCLFSV